MDTATTTTTANTTTTIERYLATWNEADAATRLAESREVWADDGRLADPLVDATGPEGISAAIGGLRDQMPGHTMHLASAIDTHHDFARFAWAVKSPDGAVAVAGTDVVTFDAAGRIRSAIGFFGELTPAG